MKIDLENYPYWLLLYVDNELTGDEKQQAEALLRQYPEIRNDLDLLSKTLQAPDRSIQFPGMSALIKNSSAADSTLPVNKDTHFLLYHDHELSSEEQKRVEAYAASDPSLQKEFESAKMLRMVPDLTIRYPEKEKLYRRKRRYPLFKINRWAMAAAACLLIAFSIVLLNSSSRNNESTALSRQSIPQMKLSGELPVNDAVTMQGDATIPEASINLSERMPISGEKGTTPEPLMDITDQQQNNAIEEKNLLTSTENNPPPAENSNPLNEKEATGELPNSTLTLATPVALSASTTRMPAASAEVPMDIEWQEEEETTAAKRNPKMKVLLRKLNRVAEKIGYQRSEMAQDRQVIRIAYMEIGLK